MLIRRATGESRLPYIYIYIYNQYFIGEPFLKKIDRRLINVDLKWKWMVKVVRLYLILFVECEKYMHI